MARNLPQKMTKHKNPHNQAAGKKHVRKLKQRNEAQILGKHRISWSYTTPASLLVEAPGKQCRCHLCLEKPHLNVLILSSTGDDDDFGDFTAPDTVDDGAAFSGRVQLEDEDAFEMGAGNVDTQQAAAGPADQAKAPKKSSKKRKQPGKIGGAATDGDKTAAVDGDTVPPKKKKKKVRVASGAGLMHAHRVNRASVTTGTAKKYSRQRGLQIHSSPWLESAY